MTGMADTPYWRTGIGGLAAAVILTVLSVGPALALDKVNLGKAVSNSFAFGIAEVGIEAKIFEQEGIDLQVTSFRGDAQLQQALATGAVDVGFGSGPAMGFHAKNVPAVAVAAFYGAPQNLALCVPMNSPIHTAADLKGKRIGVTTLGSLTDWLTRETSRQQGWGSDGIVVMPLGSNQARLAAMERGELDGMIVEAATGYELQDQNKAKNVLFFGDLVHDFYTHVIFATEDMIKNRPDVLKRYLKGMFKTIAYVKTHKDFTVKSEAKTIGVSEAVAAKVYDVQLSAFSTDGTFDPKAIEVIRRSLKELGILDFEPDPKTLYTSQFVPVKF
ncbi:MAG TPA: ABC transporter substrate-binding protein [Alphaproteobacteria bacterium]|nr:ABC transporter substrate-binding protein [Alphaproteobacteria bacterium]